MAASMALLIVSGDVGDPVGPGDDWLTFACLWRKLARGCVEAPPAIT